VSDAVALFTLRVIDNRCHCLPGNTNIGLIAVLCHATCSGIHDLQIPTACRTQLFPFPFTPNVTPLQPTPLHFFSSDFHESNDRVWCRLGGGGSCSHLPPPCDDATVCMSVCREFVSYLQDVFEERDNAGCVAVTCLQLAMSLSTVAASVRRPRASRLGPPLNRPLAKHDLSALKASIHGRRHGVDWGGHVHPTYARGRS